MKLENPFQDDITQVTTYAEDLKKDFPYYDITKYIIYTVGGRNYRFFKL